MHHRPIQHRMAFAAVLVAALVALLALPLGAAAADRPAAYQIEDVPLYQQIEAHGCGAASLQMVLDYWGPFVDQRAVYDAARTWKGSSLPDLARAAQFSAQSYSAGDQFPSFMDWGYPDRDLGYAGFYYAAHEPWLDEIKEVVAQGYPVVLLTDWLPGVYGPHYRVITGYDDEAGTYILNDPWCRELKKYFGYQGSAQQAAASGDAIGEYGGYAWTEEDFLSVWQLSTERWGVDDGSDDTAYRYGAVIAVPWDVAITVDGPVAAGEEFTVSVTATYPCPEPFGTGGFPAFPAVDAAIELALPDGFTVVDGDGAVGAMAAGATGTASFTIRAPAEATSYEIGATASGTVFGSLADWRNFPAYDYSDLIGGAGAATIMVQ